MTSRCALLLLLLLATCAVQAGAQLYQWVDDNGQVHFGNRGAPPDARAVKPGPVNDISGDIAEIAPAEPSTHRPSVVMYATDWCGYCRRARQYFHDNSIPFVEYDIEKDPAAQQRYKSFGGKAVPVIFIGKQRINGFSEQNFARIYRQPPP